MLRRKVIYADWIEKSIPRLLSFQDIRENSKTLGCFFYPYWKGRVNHTDSRWQEAVLTLAWLRKTGTHLITSAELEHRIDIGIDFWCESQHSDGSFPEYTKYERSFSATAFSTLAIAEAIAYVGFRKRWVQPLEKSGRWLCKNDELHLTNQEAAASVALLDLYRLSHHNVWLKESLRKIGIVLNNQSHDGFFYEDKKMDLSYSSLTLEMLARFNNVVNGQKVFNAARKLVSLIEEFVYPDGAFGGKYNSRSLGWLVLDGFEVFSEIPEARRILFRLFDSYAKEETNIAHIPDDRHLCTDLYRLCWAHDHCNDLEISEDSNAKNNLESVTFGDTSINRKNGYICISNPRKNRMDSLWTTSGLKIFTDTIERKSGASFLSRMFGFLGTHRFQKYKYFFLSKEHSLPNARARRGSTYRFSDNSIAVSTNKKEDRMIFVKGRTFKIIAPNEVHIVYPGERVTITSCGAEITCTDLGRKSLNDSLFYGDRSLEFLEINLLPKRGAHQFQYIIGIVVNDG